MLLIKNIKDWKKIRSEISGSLGLVPTMGNLHLGHASLIERSKSENNFTVLSIFINPTQFDNKEDLDCYPRTMDDDLRLATDLKVDYVLSPEYKEIYPDNGKYAVVENSELSECLEGQCRPGHFSGMLTVVLKLLLLASPDRAYFGEKDYQQLMLVKHMVDAFLLSTEIVACPTVRNEDGLALSSRNGRLTPGELRQAALFPKLLSSSLSVDEVKGSLIKAGFIVDYIEERYGRRFGAVRLGSVRLIDNHVTD